MRSIESAVPPAADGQAPAVRGREAVALVAEQLRSERRWLSGMRLVAGCSAAAWLLLLSWAFSPGPLGVELGDYGAQLAVGVMFALATVFFTGTWIYVWGPMFRRETPAEFLRVLFGAQLLVRSGAQFRDRLALECRRSRRGGRPFSLVVIELPDAEGERRRGEEPRVSLPALFVRSVARTGDVVGDLQPRAVTVLAIGAGAEQSDTIVRRFARALSQASPAIPSFAGARIGASTFGTGGTRPDELLEAARIPDEHARAA